MIAATGVDAIQKQGYTALMDAAVNGKTDAVCVLLTGGADLSAKDKDGNTALTWAENGGYPEIAALLRQAGSR